MIYLTTIWSEDQYEDILWDDNNVFFKTNNNKYFSLNIEQVLERSDFLEKENTIFSKNEDWFDIFYFSPFDVNSGNTGTYYAQIKKEGKSEFATSFSSQDVSFNYEIIPYYDNGIVYLINENMPEVLAKIIKIGDDYYIDSKLIKVYSDKITYTKHGYKLNKGFPEY